MSDLISREAAIDAMYELMGHWFGADSKDEKREIKREFDKLPSAQPTLKALSTQPERKPGKWIEFDSDEDKYDIIKCSCCKHTFTVDSYHWTDIGFVKDDFNFCPNCGARMRGGEDEQI